MLYNKDVGADLLKTKQQLQTILDTVPALIFYKDMNNRIVKANKAYLNAFGFKDFNDVINKPLNELFKDADKFFNDDIEVIRTGATKKVIERVDLLSGECSKWFETIKLPYIDENDEIIGVVGISVDITEHIRLQNQLESANKKLSSIINNIEDVFVVIEKGVCILSNKSWDKLLSKTTSDKIVKVFTPYINTVLTTGKSIEVRDFEIELAGTEESLYYNFLFYKYNGGIGVLGRKILDTPSQLTIKLSQANAKLDQVMIERGII